MLGITGFGIFGIVFGVICIITLILFCVLVPIREYFKCLFSSARIGAFRLRAMKVRGLPYKMISEWYIYAKKSGLNLPLDELEVHFASGGNLQNVVLGLVQAKNACVSLSFDTAKALDLEGRDIKQIVDETINTRVISTGEFRTVSIDNKEIIFEVNISIKTKLDNYLKGLKEDTIISRVKESIICSVAGEESGDIVKNADVFTKTALVKKLDKDSCFKIVDISVASVKIGKDYEYEKVLQENEHRGQMQLIEIDRERAQAQLEEQRLKNKVQEERLRKAKLESDMVEKVNNMVEEGKMDMVEYYKLQNLMADTNMRNSILSSLTTKKDA